MKRKIIQGKYRDKAKTKLKILNAVGKILKTKGHAALTVGNISAAAGIDKKLIYLYFGGAEKLVEQYIKQQDYWSGLTDKTAELLADLAKDNGFNLSLTLLKEQFDQLYHNKEMQKIILWEITEKNKLMRKIADKKEELGAELLKLTDPLFEGTDVDIRAIQALNVAGLYYLVLHAATNGSTVCGININTENDRKRIEKTLEKVLTWAYDDAKQQCLKK